MRKPSFVPSLASRFLPTSITPLIFCLLSGPLPASAAPLQINVVLAPTSENPPSDPAGAQLAAIMQTASEYWEYIIRDEGVVFDIVFGYDTDLGDAGQACYTNPAGGCLDGMVVGTMPSTAAIAFNPTLQWYFDPTPNDHSEYDLQQTLAGELTPMEAEDDILGVAPEQLEVSFSGPALPTAPAAAQNGVDMLSVALHEIGHVLGILNEFSLPEAQDGAFDFNPDFVDGAEIGARIVAENDTEHLAAGAALMRPGFAAGIRYLPSALDVFAIAAAPGWLEIHLPRREFWSDEFYHLPENWSGAQVPGSSDDVWVRSGAPVGLNDDAAARNLVVSDETALFTMDQTLLVYNDTTIERGVGSDSSTIDVEGGLASYNIQIRDSGSLAVDGGQVQAITIETEPGGTLGGHGSVIYESLDNRGSLVPAGSGTLTVVGWTDLDGSSETGLVDATAGDLSIVEAISDPFDGVMTVGPGRTVELVEPWAATENATLHLEGGAFGNQARIEGGELTLQGTAEISGHARIAAALNTDPTTVVQVAQGAELELQSTTYLGGGSFTGPGTVQLNGDVTVVLPTVMETSIVDLDGAGPTEILLADNSLTLEVDGVDLDNNFFDGTLHVQGSGANLRVQLQDPIATWGVDGVLHLTAGTTASSTALEGSDVVIYGELIADGLPRSEASLELIGTLSTATPDTRLFLGGDGTHVFRQTASVLGSGRVVIENPAELQLEDGFDEPLRLINEGQLTIGVDATAIPWIRTYNQATTGSLDLEIGGLTAGAGYDRLRVTGNARLAGRLRVALVNGFVPQLGDRFDVLTSGAGSVIGTWGTVSLPSLDPGLRWRVFYGADTVTLEVVAG